MKKLLLALVAFGCANAMSAQTEKATIVLGGATMTIDTLFHAQVGPGTTQTQLHLSGTAPLDVFYLTIDKTTPGVSFHVVEPGDKMAGTSRTSLMAQSKSTDTRLYFAGTNGDFYATSGAATDGTSIIGTPTYSAAVSGETFRSSNAGYQFSYDAEGVARICRLNWLEGTASANGVTVPMKAINNNAVNDAVTLYTPRGWTSPCQGGYAGSCAEVTAKLVEGDAFVSGGTYRVQVTSTATSTGDVPVPADGCVLMARGSAVDFINGLAIGDIVTIDEVIKTPEGERISPMEIVSGNPKNVGGGVNLNSEGERGDASSRHPRTGIGISADGNTIIMMVVDGRGASYGVTTGMLADLFIRAGADQALNIDGGGSSTLYTAALGIRNTCSDGKERSVGNAIFATVDGNVNDTEVASLAFADFRFDSPVNGTYTPRVFAFNAAGVMINNDFKDYTLSCSETLGEIVNDGKSLWISGTQSGNLTVSYGSAKTATMPIWVHNVAVSTRLSSVLLSTASPYTVELQTVINDKVVAVTPDAYSWSSSDVAVATIDEFGTINPVAPGECTVTGVLGDANLSLNVKVEAFPGVIVPVEETFENWAVSKSLVSSVAATALDNGLRLDYTMGTNTRSPKITLKNRKDMVSRPTAVRIRMSSASVNPAEFSLTICAADTKTTTIVKFTETMTDGFAAEGETVWTIPLSDYMDVNDAAIYPVEFVQLAIQPADAAKATGFIELPGIEVLYPGSESGVDNPVIVPAEGPVTWYTIDGIVLPAIPSEAGIYIRRQGDTATKVIIQ